MLKLTSILKGYNDWPVYIAPRHIVGVYPHRIEEGCFIELSTAFDPDQPTLHVRETAEQIVAMMEGGAS